MGLVGGPAAQIALAAFCAPASLCQERSFYASLPPQVKLLMPKGGSGEDDSTARLVMRVENVERHVQRSWSCLRGASPRLRGLPTGLPGAAPTSPPPSLNTQVGRLILNAPLLPSTSPAERPTDTSLRLVLYSTESASTSSSSKPSHFVLRVKIPAEAEALQAAINKCLQK